MGKVIADLSGVNVFILKKGGYIIKQMIYLCAFEKEAKLVMSATVTGLRESSDKGETELVKCANESNTAGNRHKIQHGQSVHTEQTSLTQSSVCFFFLGVGDRWEERLWSS